MRRTLRLRIGRDTVRADLSSRGRILWSAEAGHAGPVDLVEVLTRLTAELPASRKPSRVSVELDPPLVQIRTLGDLPPVRDSALAALVANQAARFFRRNGTSLVTDAVWLSRRGAGPRVAEAAAIEEPWVDAIVSAARQAGFRLTAITVAGNTDGRRLDMLPANVRAARRRADLSSLRRLGLLLAAVWAGIACLLVVRLWVEGSRIERELDRITEPAAAVAAARREMNEAAAMVQAIQRSETERGALLTSLATIALALPDSCYLTSLVLDQGGNGTLTGAAREAIRVLAALERNGILAPRLEGPAVREVTAGKEWDRFTIRFGKRGTR